MAAGTPTQGDSFWLSQSSVFKNRVQSALIATCTAINSEATTGNTGNMPVAVHIQRKNMVAQILNPASFTNWLTMFVMLCSVDSTVIAQATVSATNYTPITSASIGDTQAADGQSPIITDVALANAVSAAFNAVVAGV